MLFRQTGSKKIKIKKIDRLGKKILRKQKIKKERNCSRRRIADLLTPMNRSVACTVGKASFCTSIRKWKSASLAVETAFVLPLFFMGMVTMISFMDVYKLETEKLVALCERTKKAGMYAYALDESGPEEITLPDFYSYQPIGGWIYLPKIWLHNVVKVHAWTGKEYSDEESGESTETEEMVWVTETGTVYHVDPACTYLDLSIRTTDGSTVKWKTNAYGAHYNACESCSRNEQPAEVVFITDSGTSYHNLETCSGLKRTVRMVLDSQVEGMHVCSRCG